MGIEYLLWLQGLRESLGAFFTMLFNGISYLPAVSVGISVVLYWCFNKKNGRFAFLAFAFGNVVGQTLKNIVCEYRPWIKDARIIPDTHAVKGATGYSFPSQHTESAGSVFGAFAVKYKKKLLTILCIFLVLLVAFSRNYLDVHMPQDVLAGMGIAILVLLAMSFFEKWYEKKERNDLVWMLVGLAIDAGLILFTVLKAYPMDYVNGQILVDPVFTQLDAIETYGLFGGFLIGWYLEKKYVAFTTEGLDTKTKIIRILIGLVIVAVTVLGSKYMLALFAEGRIVKFVEGTFAGFSVIYLAPMIFKKIEDRKVSMDKKD